MSRMTAAANEETVRLRLELAYDGTDFSGWARQPDRRTVQQTVEAALALVLRTPDPRLTVAGRTDAGVHARGQVCHLDLPVDLSEVWAPAELQRRLSRLLPDDVVCQRVSVAAPGFDARFSALARQYAYRVDDRPQDRDPLRRRFVLGWPRALDADAMAAAGQGLLGEHDFAAYCRPREGATTIRTLHEVSCSRVDGELLFAVAADAFCHNMVRALVGSMLVVGEGRQPPAWPGEVLAAGVRDSRVPVIAPHGLTLERVVYPHDSKLASQAAAARTVRTLR
jgi:tRNA pseudouridine38-40 synthase